YYQGFTFELNDLFPGANVGVPEVSHNTHMAVYPNPAVDQLNITLSQNADITIYNIMGQNVMNVEGHAGANTINISNLTSGVYFVNAGSDTQKFIVK
ncbi:MAG: T9SS type A sorting domain-containing protein, partial [Bacteroidales bacterium]|nr:T9SS type A sorting domain-containing protein [Bacteroidales bacterium]MBO7618207.1 T9SS type A sorting domain-containing protein [Bacteroidales bacterium]